MENLAVARQQHREPLNTETFDGFKTVFFESPGAVPLSPQGNLIEQNPGWVLNTHFHLQHQFQVVAHGSGTLGSHVLGRMSVHYASPEAGYGPITAGPEGLWYFTLRAVHDTGSWHLPKWRSKLRPGLRRSHAMGHAPFGAALPSVADVQQVIAPSATGMAAWLFRVPPSQAFKVPPDEAGVGRFYIVATGSMQVDGTRLPELSLLFVSADERDFTINATEEGVEVVAVQFPSDALNA